MNKSELKKFAVSIRNELISLTKAKTDYFLNLDIKNLPIEHRIHKKSIQTIIERCMKDNKKDKEKYENFIEESAYIWFNRLIALRFMDLNDISNVKVVSPIEGNVVPEIFSLAKAGEISDELNIDKERFFKLIDKKIEAKDGNNEAYRMLFISACNYYSKLMPSVFEKIADYTELLLPDDLLSSNSVRAKIVNNIKKEDCEDVEIVGWLYQFYISEKKDDVFKKLKKNIKITASNIPAATQLFTPHWIVRYMVENSLGKLWLLNHPNSNIKQYMKYYIEEENPPSSFLKVSSPEDLTLFDPCCGSGHILTYAFDLLTLIYEEEGYSKSEIPYLILKNNLFGCDIDKRAATLANFALTMKARLYYRRFFKKQIGPNIFELSNQNFEKSQIEKFIQSLDDDIDDLGLPKLYESFDNIKNLGSITDLSGIDVEAIKNKLNEMKPPQDVFLINIYLYTKETILPQAELLSKQYSCVVTNPPYMGSKGMNKELSDFVKKHYPDSKSDLFAVFMEKGLEFTKEKGYMAMINQHSWMFLSSFEQLRKKIIKNHTIDTLVHLGPRAFEEIGGEVVQSVAFVLQKVKSAK